MAISDATLEKIVSGALDEFYHRRIQKLSGLKLDHTIKRKNPYMFRAIGIEDASELVELILAAFTSSSDEGIFGDVFFEPVLKAVSGGKSSQGEGADVVIETKKKVKAIAVKSGPSVFNAQSRRRQNQEFQKMRSRLLKLQKHFEALVGYGYGRKESEPGGDWIFRELAGQAFWADVTGEENFYLRLMNAMKEKPLEHKQQYMTEWASAKNRFTAEFINKYCNDGVIDWKRILEANSARKAPKDK